MRNIERPGVNQKWRKSWKADRRNLTGWLDGHGPEIIEALGHYVTKSSLEVPPGMKTVASPSKTWINIGQNLTTCGFLRLFEFEARGMDGVPFDTTLAVRAFAAIYTAEMISLHGLHVRKTLFGEESGYVCLEHLPFVALGVVIGCKDQAFKLVHLLIENYRKTNIDESSLEASYPIFHFILRILADYLEEPPIILVGEPLKEPIFNMLFDLWREPGAEALVDVCLAACDFHTHRCFAGNNTVHEFENGSWTRTPIEILLIFKLRQLLGLPNPLLDHPLMNTPLGKLPEKEISFSEIANEPDNLIYRVRECMMREGYDEEEIAGYYQS